MQTDSSNVVWQEQTALIIGRAYPEPSKKHIETVCTGAITEDGRLLRLYPISWRYLNENQKYKLWSWAKFEIAKSHDDKRKESYRVREESIQVLSNVESRSEQWALLQKAISPDRETLERSYREDWTSIGVVEIEYVDFRASKPRTDWGEAKPYTKQSHLYVDVKPLEQSPVDLKLRFRCKNNSSCKTHFCRLIGWSIWRHSANSEIGMPRLRRHREDEGGDHPKVLGSQYDRICPVGDPLPVSGVDDRPTVLLPNRSACDAVLIWRA